MRSRRPCTSASSSAIYFAQRIANRRKTRGTLIPLALKRLACFQGIRSREGPLCRPTSVSLFATFKEVLKPTIFREYDIRGIAETELLSPDVADLGRAFGTMLQAQERTSGQPGPRLPFELARDCMTRCSKAWSAPVAR